MAESKLCRSVGVTFLTASGLLISMSAIAGDACTPKNVNVCELARKISDETAATLPMQLNSNLSLQTVFAESNTVAMVARLNYTHAFLDQKLTESGVSNDEMIKILYNVAFSGLCERSSRTEYFVERGGQFRYIYKFMDGTTYTTVSITSCASPAKP